jgi:alkylated DNA nucleotide flippase Atl1
MEVAMSEAKEKEVLEMFRDMSEKNRDMFLSYGRVIRAAGELAVQDYQRESRLEPPAGRSA